MKLNYFIPHRTELFNTYIYEQYKENKALQELTAVLDNFIRVNYIEFLEYFLLNINSRKANNLYLSFYALHYLGVKRPLGAPSLNAYYDVEDKFDNKLIYDDTDNYDGGVGVMDFSDFLSFTIDYGNEVFNIPTMHKFACKWLNLQPSEVEIIQSADKTTFLLPQSARAGDFVKLTFAYHNALGFPYGVKVEYRFKEASN